MVITIGESTRQAVKLLDSFHQSWLDILEFFFSKTRMRATYLCIKKKGSSNSRSAPWPWMGLDILELKWRCPSRTRRDNLSALLLLCLCNWREGANVTDTFLVGIKTETPAGCFMLCTLHTARQVAWSNCWYSSNTAFSIYHLPFLLPINITAFTAASGLSFPTLFRSFSQEYIPEKKRKKGKIGTRERRGKEMTNCRFGLLGTPSKTTMISRLC